MGFPAFLLTALALVLILEGLVWALFTARLRQVMAQALTLPDKTLRTAGAGAAAAGFGLLLLLQLGHS